MRFKIIMTLFLALVLISFAFAAEIETAETIALMNENTVTITSEFQLSFDKSENFLFEVPEDVKKVEIKVNNTVQRCSIEKENKITIADCGKIRKGSHSVVTNFTTAKPIENLEKQIMFKFEDNLPFKAKEYVFTLKLLPGHIIPKKEGSIDFFLSPNPDETSSDGQRISISWKDRLVQKYSVLAITQPLVDQESQNTFTITLAAIVIGIILLVVVLYFFKLKNKTKRTSSISKPKKKKKKEVVPELIESEQKIVDLLKASPNKELWQKQLLQESNFSKAKLSRIVRNLESRGVVIKTIYGNTNKIVLREK